MSVLIVGAGAWGTTVGTLLARKGIDVRLWARSEDVPAEMERARENRRYLPDVTLPDSLHVVGEVGGTCDAIVNGVPTQYIRATYLLLKDQLPDAPIVSLSKGIEIATGKLPTAILEDVLGPRDYAVLTGPCIAHEVVRGQPTAVVLAGDRAEALQPTFVCDTLRVYTSPDRVGVEIGAALKNVMGLAAGIVDGLELGDNAKAALLTRGIVEISRLGEAMGANRRTFAGLAGFGDLFTTCVSPYGRNRGVGERIGRGESVDQILASMTAVAEGVPTTRAVAALAKTHGVEMPITEALSRVLFEGLDPREAIATLMTRAARPEH